MRRRPMTESGSHETPLATQPPSASHDSIGHYVFGPEGQRPPQRREAYSAVGLVVGFLVKVSKVRPVAASFHRVVWLAVRAVWSPMCRSGSSHRQRSNVLAQVGVVVIAQFSEHQPVRMG